MTLAFLRAFARRGLLALLAGTAVLVGLAMYGIQTRTAALRLQDGAGPVFPALRSKDAINAVDRLEIDDGGTTIVLVRAADGGWSVASIGHYPADATAVKAALMGLSSLEYDQRLTATASKHASLGLEYPRSDSAEAAQTPAGGESNRTGTRLRAFAGSEEPLAAAIVGQSTFQPRTQAIRLDGDDQVWRVKGSVEARADHSAWIKTDLVSIPTEQVQRIAFEGLEISRRSAPGAAEANAASPAVPPGMDDWDVTIAGPVEWEAADANRAKGPLTSLLTRLEVDDLRQATDLSACDTTTLHYTLDAGTLDLTMWAESGRTWIAISGTGAPVGTAGFQFRLPEWKANQIKNLRPPPRSDDSTPAAPTPPATPPPPVSPESP